MIERQIRRQTKRLRDSQRDRETEKKDTSYLIGWIYCKVDMLCDYFSLSRTPHLVLFISRE